ncbi:MAG: hypothetical protein WEE89_11555 [Gemmatimonadota bacterium]
MKRQTLAFRPWCILRATLAAVLVSASAAAQQANSDLHAVQRVHQRLVELRERADIWPGFRPDTLPYLFVLPGRGHALVNWRGPLPEGFLAIDGLPRVGFRAQDALRAASTSTEFGGRMVAQVSVDAMNERALVAIAAHEAFHVFEGSSRSAGSYFGEGENSFLVSSYPVFDSINEAQFSLEARLLSAALTAGSLEDARLRVREFSAVRAARHRRLGLQFAEFEAKAELNEGLAEYALLRMQNAFDGKPVDQPPAELLQNLGGFTREATSLRIRFYRTGPAQALLLDRLAGPGWKQQLGSERILLHDLLARAAGAWAEQDRLRGEAEKREDYPRLSNAAASNLDRLRASRRAKADSILAAPGMRVVISTSELPNRSIGWCGIDPQNLLQASATMILHTRWVIACSGQLANAEFNTPVVQDRAAEELQAIIPSDARITADGQEVKLQAGSPTELRSVRIESRTFNARFARAELRLDGNVLRIVPKP